MSVIKLKSFVGGRVRRIRGVLDSLRLGGLVVIDPVDVRYLTGFGGDDSVLLLTGNKKVLVTDSRYVQQARRECPSLALKVRTGSMAEAVREVLNKSVGGKWKLKVGIVADDVSLAQYKAYRKVVGKRLVVCKPVVAPLRVCKDRYELCQIRKAVRVAEKSITELLDWLKVGVTEQQAKAYLEYRMACNGSTEPAFSTIVAFGGHAAEPHAVSGRKRLRKGMGILVDWGATVNGYKSDLTRCFFAGRIPGSYADAYRAVLGAQLVAIAAVRPGVRVCEIDAAARKNWPEKLSIYGHGTGHGLGLKVHERPCVSGKVDTVLKEGMVITIEPGAYVPGGFGIRIEDDVVVTAKGATVLSKIAKGLNSIALRK